MYLLYKYIYIHTQSALQFCRSISYTFIFPAYKVNLLSFLVNLRTALYQKGLRLIHISFKRIDRIIMAKMDYMEN